MLVRLRSEDLAGGKPLAYDLLNSQGQVLYAAGDLLESHKVAALLAEGVFRHKDQLPFNWIVEEEFPGFSQWTALEEIKSHEATLQEIENEPGLLNTEEAKPFLISMQHFWKTLETGKPMDVALLDVMGHQLVQDIVTRMNQLRYLNQLRIRDEVTYSHTLDVTAVSIALGAKAGLGKKDLEMLALGGMLHDLGKLFIPKPIMFKQTRLTDKEFEVMQRHPELGYQVIKEHLKLPNEVALPALEHQELYAGGGYPQNLQGNEIHYFSQIVKIADVYDALTSRRPYKESIDSYRAIQIMLLEGSKSFNPDLLRAFLELANFPKEEIPNVL